MTENKRFKYVEFSKYMLSFEDNGVCKFFHEKDFEDWLNELHEEKELLKKELSEQGTQLDFLKDENIHMRNVLNENKQLKKENNDLKTSKEYWREKCLSKDSYNKFHHKAPIWFTQELKLTNKEVNKVAEAIEQNLKERRIKE